MTLQFGFPLHPLRSEQIVQWYIAHLDECPECAKHAQDPLEGHADSNVTYAHFLEHFYGRHLSDMAEIPQEKTRAFLKALSVIPVSAATFRRRAQEAREVLKRIRSYGFSGMAPEKRKEMIKTAYAAIRSR